MDGLKYSKIANILLLTKEEMSIERLSLISNLPINEIEDILKFFNSEGFLVYKDNFNKIVLTSKAREVKK